ncbi:hypothetical protein SUGI_0444570 [Cryptomeria japonica]|uniref:transcription factor KUA1 n=1 Tax=Cryptomeria japonica TaxID=3369 RepID=UPI002408A562|nr:transcription factor KUA1 [Cryptomeria japonica]GLJ23470.1 hypothetical protein SUGI_0444570 [Cryptomeria japonica]
MSRRCSHCGHNGHNSRTCPDRGVKLFGVRLTTEGLMRKSVSMGNLMHYTASASSANNDNSNNSNLALTPEQSESGAADDGYVSDGMVQSSKSRERKKGVPWTEDEHKMFLLGLQKLGKGDWRGISRNFVTSRTPTQVASHAQKYFLRQSNLNKRKRRSSLFDIAADAAADYHQGIPQFSAAVREHNSRNFFESGPPNFAMSMGPFSLPSFSPSLINPHPLSLTTSKAENPIVDKIAGEKAAFSILKMVERQDSREPINSACHYSFPLRLGPELATNTRHVTKSSAATKPPNLETKESIENSGLNLSIAPPCADLSNNIGSNSNAIRVL